MANERELLDAVFELCLSYAEKYDTPIEVVVVVVGETLIKFANNLNLQ